MKKNSKLHIAISTEQKALLKKRADSVGLSLSQYCLFVLIQAKPQVNDT